MITDTQELVRIYQALKSARKTVEGTWQDIERYVIPYRGEFFTDYTSEQQIRHNRPEIYDSTAINSASTLAASIQSGLTPPTIQWFDLVFRHAMLRNDKEAREWLEECSKLCFQAIQESNFNTEINETYLDLATLGTSVISEEAKDDLKWDGLDFQSVPLRDCFFEEDSKTRVLRFYRRLEWQYAQICDKFGEENLPEGFAKNGNGKIDVDQKHEIMFCIYPRRENADKEQYSGIKAAELRPYGFKYVLTKGQDVLKEGGYYEMPAFVARWLKTSGSMWGHSPATIAMADIKTLNKTRELVLLAGEKVLDPTTLVTERGLIGDLHLEKGGLTVVRALDQIKPYESAARFDVSQNEIDAIQESIRETFHMNDLQLKQSPAMTATEVIARVDLMNRVLGPVTWRIQNDVLDGVVQRTFNIMFRAGQLPAPPGVVTEHDGALDIEYSGPLARSQKAERVSNVERWIAGIQQNGQIDPEILDNVDFDWYTRETHEMLGVPTSMLRGAEEVRKKREERKALQQQQMEMEKMAIAAQSFKDAGSGAASMSKANEVPEGSTVQ